MWQGLAGVQAAPLLHATQLPELLQTMPVPQVAPDALLPFSLQTCVPVEQEKVPVLQGLVGWHVPPAVQATHWPPRQTCPVPQDVPSDNELDASVHTGVPVEHASVPAWQRLAGVQLEPLLHDTQLPLEQTMPVPQEAPSDWLALSTHVDIPVAHDVVPVRQAAAT